VSGGFVNSDLAALAGGDTHELMALEVRDRYHEAWDNLRDAHPFFFYDEFPIPTAESRHTNP
jgi:hypothetical protein